MQAYIYILPRMDLIFADFLRSEDVLQNISCIPCKLPKFNPFLHNVALQQQSFFHQYQLWIIMYLYGLLCF